MQEGPVLVNTYLKRVKLKVLIAWGKGFTENNQDLIAERRRTCRIPFVYLFIYLFNMQLIRILQSVIKKLCC